MLGQSNCEDQSVLELRKTVYALHDIKLMMQDLISVEEKILGQMTRRTGRPRGGGGGGGGEITGREGQTLTLKCRYRNSNVTTWTMQRASGEVETIQKAEKKLKVVVGPDTIGVYRCYSGSSLLNTFALKLEA